MQLMNFIPRSVNIAAKHFTGHETLQMNSHDREMSLKVMAQKATYTNTGLVFHSYTAGKFDDKKRISIDESSEKYRIFILSYEIEAS